MHQITYKNTNMIQQFFPQIAPEVLSETTAPAVPAPPSRFQTALENIMRGKITWSLQNNYLIFILKIKFQKAVFKTNTEMWSSVGKNKCSVQASVVSLHTYSFSGCWAPWKTLIFGMKEALVSSCIVRHFIKGCVAVSQWILTASPQDLLH